MPARHSTTCRDFQCSYSADLMLSFGVTYEQILSTKDTHNVFWVKCSFFIAVNLSVALTTVHPIRCATQIGNNLFIFAVTDSILARSIEETSKGLLLLIIKYDV